MAGRREEILRLNYVDVRQTLTRTHDVTLPLTDMRAGKLTRHARKQ